MTWLLILAGGALSLSGLAATVDVDRLHKLLFWFQLNRRYGLAVVGRLALGLALVFGAAGSRLPVVAIGLGLLFLLGATAVPILGEERIGAMLGWWLRRPPIWMRAWGISMMVTGLFILWLGLV
jgi:hypothetical protein